MHTANQNRTKSYAPLHSSFSCVFDKVFSMFLCSIFFFLTWRTPNLEPRVPAGPQIHKVFVHLGSNGGWQAPDLYMVYEQSGSVFFFFWGGGGGGCLRIHKVFYIKLTPGTARAIIMYTQV